MHTAGERATEPVLAREGADARLPAELQLLLAASVVDLAIFALAPDGTIATWNPGAERLYGYAADEVIGRPYLLLLPDDARPADGIPVAVREAAAKGRYEEESMRRHRAGHLFPVHVIVTPIRDGAGAIVGFAKVTRDLTTQRAAEEQGRRLAAERAAREMAEQAEAEARHLVMRLQEQAVELEAQMEEAQALTEELEQTNEVLQQVAAEAEEAREAAEAARVRAEELQARYQQLFDSSPLPKWTVDRETLRILDVNEAAIQRYGWTREEFLRLTLHDLRTPEEAARIPDDMHMLAETGRAVWRTSHRDKWGTIIDADVNGRAIVQDGRPAVVAAIVDVTERRRAEARQRFLVEASSLLAGSLDYDETLQALARAAVPRLGDWCAVDMRVDADLETWPPVMRRLAVMHQDPAKIAWAHELESRLPPDWSAPTGLPRVLREGVTEHYPMITDELLVAAAKSPEELALLREIGFSAYLCVPLVVRGRPVGAITLAMTESRRRYDDGDRALAEELARRASQAIEHATLYREAQQANAAKSQFLAVMSHELRTPLNAIGGYAELLEMGVRGPLTAAQKEDVLRIRRSQQHLLGLINDVLNFARIEAGQAQYQTADVAVSATLDAVVSLVAPQAQAKALRLDVDACDPSIVVRADADRVQQVLLNLLGNAVKFTPPGGRITVTCERHGDVAVLRVADTGVGIPADRLHAVFEPFVQVHTGLTRPSEGTGLGLAISRDLARGMGGELTVESVEGEGSTFTLTLPMSAG